MSTVLCVYAPTGHSTREQLDKEKKKENEGNENKIIRGDINCTLDKMERDDRNKTYRCCFNNTLSKTIVDNGTEDL